MKALKIIGIVAGIHAFALLIIFANPGCSSTKAAVQSDGTPKADDGSSSAVVPAPSSSADGDAVTPAPAPGGGAAAGVVPAPTTPGITFTPAESAPPAVLYTPTRPGTAAAAALEEQPVEDVTPATTYTVVKGDALSTIAKRNHTTRAALAAANHLKAGATLRIGQKLLIPAATPGAKGHAAGLGAGSAGSLGGDQEARPAAGSGASSRAGGESTRYVVKPGESLGVIARRFGVRVGDIAAANSIADPKKIRPGQELIIPARSASGGHASSAAKAPAPARREETSGAGATEAPAVVAPDAAAPAAVVPAPAPSSTDSAGRPTVTLPAAGQDLDSGLAPASTAESDVPVVKVEDGGKP